MVSKDESTKIMQKEKLTKIEKRANELFGEKSIISVAEIKVANKGYIVRIKMQGMPFEISAMQDTLEEAEELAYSEFEKHVADALENNLFPTQPIENYKEIKLTDEQFTKLFKYEELLSEEYCRELKEKTVAKMCQLPNGKYECVIESPYMCLHARATSASEKFSIFFAITTAHDIFRSSLIYVGKKPWSN